LKQQLSQKEPDSLSIKFIKQKRSELWLVRKIFGTYGKTFTSSLMMDEINKRLEDKVVCKNQGFKKKFHESVDDHSEHSELQVSSKKLK
jgi:hypothetical protein